MEENPEDYQAGIRKNESRKQKADQTVLH